MDEQYLLDPGDNYNLTTTASSGSSTSGSSSNAGWIIIIVILLLIALGLGIWLIVLYSTGHVNNGNGRTLTLPGAKITANSTSITGTWGTLDNEGDTVTLYASTDPLIISNTGVVTNPGVLKDSKTGSGGDADINNVTPNQSYNAVLIATAADTSHYHIYGPVVVYTQDQTNLVGRSFQIDDLTNPGGSVSNSGTYTNFVNDKGLYRLGSTVNTNAQGANFLVALDSDNNETENILCRIPNTNNVGFLRWSNITDSDNPAPAICGLNTSDDNCQMYDPTLCQWSYNISPPVLNGVSPAGENLWCLRTTQSFNTNNVASTQIACMSHSGSGLTLASSAGANKWFNTFNSSATFVTLQ